MSDPLFPFGDLPPQYTKPAAEGSVTETPDVHEPWSTSAFALRVAADPQWQPRSRRRTRRRATAGLAGLAGVAAVVTVTWLVAPDSRHDVRARTMTATAPAPAPVTVATTATAVRTVTAKPVSSHRLTTAPKPPPAASTAAGTTAGQGPTGTVAPHAASSAAPPPAQPPAPPPVQPTLSASASFQAGGRGAVTASALVSTNQSPVRAVLHVGGSAVAMGGGPGSFGGGLTVRPGTYSVWVSVSAGAMTVATSVTTLKVS